VRPPTTASPHDSSRAAGRGSQRAERGSPTGDRGGPPADRIPDRPTVTLTPRGVARAGSGHLWIYRSDIVDVQAEAGDIVQVVGPRGRPVGEAFFSDKSQIALRLVPSGATAGAAATATIAAEGDALWRARLKQAIAFRESLAIDATAYRLVHGEGDLLPSLIVDRYGDYLVIQTLSQATDRLLPVWVALLNELVAPQGILARNDGRVRGLEGLESKVEVVSGEVPEHVEVREGSVRYDVDLYTGQKTGLFLDQRENRQAALQHARGRLLDCFSYHGGFALALAPRCTEVVAIESSEEASRHIRENAARNGITSIDVRTTNVFDELRELDRGDERFDTIVLDPPAFAKSRAALEKAMAGYKEINLRALKLLAPGGTLITCTCSHHVDEATFGEIVYAAALDAQAHVSIIEKRMQSRDHPILLGVPETYYLKCFILRKL
jgi:23S rRNA (cytosine1962-C5)-methyltransferase